MKLLPKGLWPVMLTPFNQKNEIDYEGLERLTEFYIAAGSNGLFANCLSSEMFQLTADERIQLTREVVKITNRRVPVVSTGSFGDDMTVTADFVKKIYDQGVEAVIISTSQLCSEMDNDDRFKSQMETLINQTGDIPLGLYECPVPYKRLMSPELIGWMAKTNRFLFHKDTSCNIDQIKLKLKAIEGTSLRFYNAHVPTAVDSMKAGAHGIAPISANLYPEVLAFMLSLVEHEEMLGSCEDMNLTLDMLDTIIHFNYPHTAKLYLNKRGINISTQGRISRGAMTALDFGKIDTIKSVIENLSEKYNIKMVSDKALIKA